MKLSQPRIAPLTEAEWTDEQRKVLEPVHTEGRVYNVRGTLARHWEASKKFGVWGYHVMGNTSTLPPRERELLILRTGWLCQAEYEWGQHVIYGKAAGLTDAEIARIKEGPDAEGWAPFDATLLGAADELHADACISDATWAALSKRYNARHRPARTSRRPAGSRSGQKESSPYAQPSLADARHALQVGWRSSRRCYTPRSGSAGCTWPTPCDTCWEH